MVYMYLIIVISFLIYRIIKLVNINKILENNYLTAMMILSETDPKLKEYLEKDK